jgi:hypothetical protein
MKPCFFVLPARRARGSSADAPQDAIDDLLIIEQTALAFSIRRQKGCAQMPLRFSITLTLLGYGCVGWQETEALQQLA